MATALISGLFSHTKAAVTTPLKVYALSPTVSGDIVDKGKCSVVGTLKIKSSPDVPVWRRVRLFCQVSGRLVRETWSDPVTGAYRFEYVRQGPWLVVAHDYTGSYNAVVADNILGEPM